MNKNTILAWATFIMIIFGILLVALGIFKYNEIAGWGFVKGRLESVMQEAKVKQEKIFYVGRSPAASPAAGSLERHLSNQETIIKMATEDSISKIIKSWAGISTKLKTNLPIE